MKLNRDKCEFRKDTVSYVGHVITGFCVRSYVGHVITGSCVRPDTEKIALDIVF